MTIYDGRSALLSVSKKEGIEPFAQGLVDLGLQVISTGRTEARLNAAEVPVTPIAEINGGEALGGRVKTLSRPIFGGMLSDSSPGNKAELQELGWPNIAVVAYNFYPLSEAVNAPGATLETILPSVDIGGPAGVAAAFKGGKIVVVDPADYNRVLDWLKNTELQAADLPMELWAKAMAAVSTYYTQLAYWLGGQSGTSA